MASASFEVETGVSGLSDEQATTAATATNAHAEPKME